MKKIFNTFRKSDNSLISTIKFFRSLHFFENYEVTDEELADLLLKKHLDYWDKDFDPSAPHSDLLLLFLDSSRVWWKDTEADVSSGRTVYKKTLQEWSAISRGSFYPSNIVEDWQTEDGPIEISFDYLDQRIVLHPKFLNDYIDLDILVQINDLIQEVQFELYQPFDQTGFVVALTSVEKEHLQKKRKWLFAYH